jgi:hypothetical protein
MLNAHLRFGWLSFVKVTEKKTTSVRVRLDRLIAEPASNRTQAGKVHLLSVIAGDTQMAAISAALSETSQFMVEGPDVASIRVSFETKKPPCYRASLQLPGRKRPIRHLIAVSEDLASATGATKIVLADSSPEFVWSATAKILGLPGAPEWAEWFHEQLVWRNVVTPLFGIGCSPILIAASRDEILSWLGDGVSSGALSLPLENRAIGWPKFGLHHVFQLPQVTDLSTPAVPTSTPVE